MSEAAGAAPATRRQRVDPSAFGVVLALCGAALAVAAVWLPYWDPASLRRAIESDLGRTNNLMNWGVRPGWLFIGLALVCTVSLVISSLRRSRTQGPIIAGAVAMGLAILAALTAPELTPTNFAVTTGTAAAGLGIYAELVAGLLMVIGGLGIRGWGSVRALVALAAVGVVIAASTWWAGSMYGGEPAPPMQFQNAPVAASASPLLHARGGVARGGCLSCRPSFSSPGFPSSAISRRAHALSVGRSHSSDPVPPDG